ncbi:MAG: ornithine cyclodeaminase family protein [Sulfolobaceae archaeon]
MALLIKEEDVEELLTFEDAYKALKDAFGLLEHKLSINTKRIRTPFAGTILAYQAGGMLEYLGFKTYIPGSNVIGILFNKEGELLAIFEADRLTRVRTTALAVLASDFIKKNYSNVAVIGLGNQGIVQVEAFYELKKLKVKVYTRSKERLDRALKFFSKRGIDVEVKDTIKDACKESEVITTITSSKDPFIKSEYLDKGSHINAMGSVIPERAEIFPEVFKMAKSVVVEDIEQAKEEAGDLILAYKMKMLEWSKLIPLSSIILDKIRPRESQDDITVFKSVGIGLEDVAVMISLYEKAKKRGVGTEIEVKGKWFPKLEEK